MIALIDGSKGQDSIKKAKHAIDVITALKNESKLESLIEPVDVKLSFKTGDDNFEFAIKIGNFAEAIQLLETFKGITEKMTSLEDVPFSLLYNQVFESGVIYEYVDETTTIALSDKFESILAN